MNTISIPRKQSFEMKLVFYGECPNGTSVFFTVVDHDLKPKFMFNHHLGRALGIDVEWEDTTFAIVNVYANSARAKLWADLSYV